MPELSMIFANQVGGVLWECDKAPIGAFWLIRTPYEEGWSTIGVSLEC